MASSKPATSVHSPHRKIWAIAWPAILANSAAPLVGLVDTWAIGHLPGATHLAAVGLGSVIFSYFLWAFGFLRMGTTGLIAQANGRDDPDALIATVLRSSALALVIGIVLLLVQGLLWTAAVRAMAPPSEVAPISAEYFRIRMWATPATLLGYALTGVLFGLARVRAILWLQLVLNLSNGILNLVFVIGLEMGVAGVAWGTLIAQHLTTAASLWVLWRLIDRQRLLAHARSAATWHLRRFAGLVLINGFIFIRTLFLMTALALIMREAARLGEVEMAASHIVSQFLLLMALGLDGFAHAAEALAGAAWGSGQRALFRRWCQWTTQWAVAASLVYALGFWVAGDAITALLTDLESVRSRVAGLLPLIAALPVVSVWCYQFDGIFIGATAGAAMMVTMGLAFAIYLAVLGPLTDAFGLAGLWAAVLLFMALRGLFQAAWYPSLERRLWR